MDMLENIPRIYTAIAEWASCVIFIFVSKRRFKESINALLIIFFLAALISWQIFAGTLPIEYWIIGMITAVVLMFLFILTCADINIEAAGTKCAQAFIIAEFTASMEWQLYYYFYMNVFSGGGKIAEIGFVVVIYSIILAIIWLLELRYYKSKIKIDIKWKDFLITASIAIVIFTISNISFVSWNTPFSARYTREIFLVRTLVDFCGIILLYSQQEQRLWLHAKNELSAMGNILKRQYEQYCNSKENIDLLNRRLHDLKHQIEIIKSEQNPEKRMEYIEELEKGIKKYQAEYDTGNRVLDVILTGKSLQCVNNEINLTCIADGTLLEFINVMDICSIFGNALDNAIESVMKIDDKEKRIIRMAVFLQGELVVIKFENYYENVLKYENGNYLTTKKNVQEHGYGLKSIKAAISKYNGVMHINTDHNWFKLCILIPYPSSNI